MSHHYIKEIRGTTPNPISSSGEIIEIDCGTYGIPTGIEIVRITVKQTSGSATSFSFSIGNKAAFSTTTVHEKYLSGSTASSGILDETDVSAFCMTSDAGKLYFKFSPNSGSDNYYVYSIMYKR